MEFKKIKLYPSGTAFMKGRLVFTDYSGGCPRKIYLNQKGVKEGDIDSKYAIMGKENEDEFYLEMQKSDVLIEREVAFKWDLPTTGSLPTAYLSGRIDFLIDGEIWELKSSASGKILQDTIKKGKVRAENLAQIIIYMFNQKAEHAYLRYTYYGGRGKVKPIRTFKISIDDYGRILIDNIASSFLLDDVLKFLTTMTDIVTKDVIWDRPYNWDSSFASPCTYCVFKSACDKYDNGQIEGAVAFVEHSDKLIKEKK